MSIDDFQLTRDRGRPVHLISFRYGLTEAEMFNYTDAVDAINTSSSGRMRVYLTIDRSRDSANGNGVEEATRLDTVKGIAVSILQYLRSLILQGQTVDVCLSHFAAATNNTTHFGATTAQIDNLISTVNGLTTTFAQGANYQSMVTHGVNWFNTAGDRAIFRNWIILSMGNPNEDSLPAAKALIAPLVIKNGSQNPNYIPTNIFAYSIGNRDVSKLRFFDNTPEDAVPVLTRGDNIAPAAALEAIRVFGVQYNPLPIKYNTLKITGGGEGKNTLVISIPKDSEIAEYYRTQRADRAMYVTIKEGQHDDPENHWRIVFSGRVVSCKREPGGATAELTCEPLSSSLRRNGLRRFYMLGCPHVLYGSECKADISRVTESFFNARPSWNPREKAIRMPDGFTLAQPTARYPGGMIWWQENGVTMRRTILRISGRLIMMNGPVGNAYLDTIRLAIGCDHTITACRNWHFNTENGGSNGINFGGQDKIPFDNPFKMKSQYY